MKNWVKLGLCGLMVVSLGGCGGGGKSDIDPQEVYGCSTLNVYNWGEYVGENVLSNFERQYNVKINYSMFASNEEMYTKLLGGSQYDVLVPSDYMIERMIDENMLQPLDKSMIPNLANLADGVKGLSYDPDNTYSAPYFWAWSELSTTRTTSIRQMWNRRASTCCAMRNTRDMCSSMIPSGIHL